jgi:hypothetical protein
MKSIKRSKPGITCSKIENTPYNLMFTTQFNDSSILITIISCDYLNLSLANEYVGDVIIPTQVIKHNQNFSKRISQSDCNIHFKLNYFIIQFIIYPYRGLYWPGPIWASTSSQANMGVSFLDVESM